MPPEPYRQVDALILDLFGVLVAFDDRLVYDRLAQHCNDPNATKAMRDLVSDRELICGRKALGQLHQQLSAQMPLR